MKNFVVLIEEANWMLTQVACESEQEALKFVEDGYNNGDILLDSETSHSDVEFSIDRGLTEAANPSLSVKFDRYIEKLKRDGASQDKIDVIVDIKWYLTSGQEVIDEVVNG